MPTQGVPSYTSNWTLENSSVTLDAFERCGKRATELDLYMWQSARRSLNLVLTSWNNKGVNLWKVMGPTTIALIANVPTYAVNQTCVSILEGYYTQLNGGGPGVNADRIMRPLSRTEYAEYPNKLTQGTPTQFWFQKDTPVPQVTLYQNPQFGQPDGFVFTYYWLQRIMDADQTSGEIPDVDQLFLPALCSDLAFELAQKPALVGVIPDNLYARLKAQRDESWALAAGTNREDVPMVIQPDLGAYWGRR